MKLFWQLDPRLLSELKRQKRSIVFGLACVAITSLLTAANIAFIDQAVNAISVASPLADSKSNPLQQNSGDQLDKVAADLGVDEAKLRKALKDSSGAAESDAIRRKALDTLGWMCLAVIGLFSIKYIFTRGQSYYLSKAATELATSLRERMFAHLQKLPITYFNSQRTGAIQSVLTNDVGVYQSAVSIIRDSIDGPIKAIAALTTIIIIQPGLALITILTFPFMFFIIQRNGRKMREAQARVQEDLSDLNASTQEALLGMRIVKAFGAEEQMKSAYSETIRKARESQLAAARRVASLRPLVELIGAAALALVLYLCGWLAFGGQLRISHIAALIYALDVINQGFRSLGHVNNTYNQVQAASDRIYRQVLDIPAEHHAASGTKTIENPTGRIVFHDVSFTYEDGTQALNKVNFCLEPGTSLALVGPSGAGKSTIADLILRFYDPTEGTITFDGVDIRELDIRWLREQMAVVPQLNFLFAGTLAENLRLGNPNATDADLVHAAHVAHANTFIDPLPNRFDSVVGERGVGLSGGEMQRISIARAIVRDPVLLLLDEATSALDAHSEKAVQEALEDVMKRRTTLFIAHRLTTAARADRILVLRKGEVVEVGSHRELLESGGVYSSMFQAFSSGMLEEQIG